MTLERLFETVGLTRGVTYELQHRDVGTESTGIYDAIVYLPDRRCIVIDAKTPMDAFDRACQAATEAERQDHLREHAQAVRNHVNALSKRNYQELESKPMYVLMYLPMEGLFTAAVQFDPDILKYADEKKIYLATPTTLMGFLRLCSLYWSEQKLAESAAEIRDVGAELYKRVGKVAEHIKKLGDHLDKSVDSFNAAVGSLDRNLISQARKFRELGATNAEIPELGSLDVKTRELQSDEFRLGSDRGVASLPLESESAVNDSGG
jgi:DNA recombination protein RmuC